MFKTILTAALVLPPLSSDLRLPGNGKYDLVRINFADYGLRGLPRGYINYQAAPSFKLILTELAETGLIKEITRFQGCYSPRFIAGTRRISSHAYGLACDFNNKRYSDAFVNVWFKHGWTWGGTWCGDRYDPMHFSYKRERNGKC